MTRGTRTACVLSIFVTLVAGCPAPDAATDAAAPPRDATVVPDARADASTSIDADAAAVDATTPASDGGTDAGPPPVACVAPASCPPCDAGETCGGGGVLHECGSRACTHFVSPTATGATFASCTTAASPCTLAAANTGARPGHVVCLAGGEYRTAIAPTTSGTRDAPIVFQAAGEDAPVLRDVVDGFSLRNVSFIEIDGVDVLGDGNTGPDRVTRFFRLVNADDCWIRNGTFRDAWAYVGSDLDVDSERNRITTCTYEDAPSPPFTPTLDAETWPGDAIEIRGGGTLLEGNTFGDVSHYAIVVWISAGHRNVVRGNLVLNRLHAGVNLLSVDGATGRVLLDGNRIYEAGEGVAMNPNLYSRTQSSTRDDGMARGRQVAVQLVGAGVLFRRNDVVAGGRGMWVSGYENPSLGTTIHVSDARVVHNTFSDNLTSLMMVNDLWMMGRPFENVVIANNLFDSPRLREVHIDSTTPDAQLIVNNAWTPEGLFRLIGRAEGDRSLAAIETAYGPYWAGNVSLDPAFVDRAARDFRLESGSSAIDAAPFLTTITSAAEGAAGGTTLVVEDAWSFYDGWDIPGEVGDVVMTESGSMAQVVEVDVVAGTVTVMPAITTTPGEGLGYAYTGAAPDLGGHEHCP